MNAYVNAGFGNDKLMAQAEEGQSWIYKNKDHGESPWSVLLTLLQRHRTRKRLTPLLYPSPGMLSAAASLGLSFLWNPDMGLDAIDKYTYVPEEYIKVGSRARIE